MSRAVPVLLSVVLLSLQGVSTIALAGPAIEWNASSGNVLKQSVAWYAGTEAVRIADNVLLYQRSTGGWPKNRPFAAVLDDAAKAKLRKEKSRADATLDNGATHTHLRLLARVHTATKTLRFRQAFEKGLAYLLAAQYDNGGWPQSHPNPRGYARHITFNDGAMIGAMSLLRDIAAGKPDFAFVGETGGEKARDAVAKGLRCILKCQIIVAGRRTAWCAQHDEKSLAPRPARIYEKASISGHESVGILRYLMAIDRPSVEVIEAVQGAVAWFDRAKIIGIRQVSKPDASLPRGFDKVVVADPAAPPIWARFYQIGTNKPIFSGRDGKVRDTLAEINAERRTGYSWYGYYATELLAKHYPAWQAKWAPKADVLGTGATGR